MTNYFLMYHHICIKVFFPNQLLYLTDLVLARQFIDTSPPAKVTHIHKTSQNMFRFWPNFTFCQGGLKKHLDRPPRLKNQSHSHWQYVKFNTLYFRSGMSNSNPCAGRTLKFKDQKTVSGLHFETFC